MDRFSVYYAGFTGHHLAGISHRRDTKVVRDHGHDWRISVEAKAGEDPDLEEALTELAGELHGRPLEEMMPGAATDATGIAAWFMERLAMRFSEVIKVHVKCAGHDGYVTREPRRMG